MGREPVEKVWGDVKVIVEPLPFPQAQLYLPDVTEVIAIVFDNVGAAVTSGKVKLDMDVLDPATLMVLLPTLRVLAQHMGQGRLDRLFPKILATTTVMMKDIAGTVVKKSLGIEAERNEVFDEHPDLFIPVLIFAGNVTYKRFFPARAR